jgi:hypothetical protein
MLFLLNNWYVATHIVLWNKIQKLNQEALEDLYTFLNKCIDKNDYEMFFPYSIWFTKID